MTVLELQKIYDEKMSSIKAAYEQKLSGIFELEQESDSSINDEQVKKKSHGLKTSKGHNWSQIYGRTNDYGYHAKCRSMLT